MKQLTFDRLMIHFGELSTKGKNKKDFVRQLAKNIRSMLSSFPMIKYDVQHDHIYLTLNEAPTEQVISYLQDVSGIHSISPVIKVATDLDTLKQTALAIALTKSVKTFKVQAKRTDKSYPLISDQLNRQIGGYVLANSELKVDVHHPDSVLKLEIHPDGAYFLGQPYAGAGGYPLGSTGKVLLMLSGGIDSPVAAYSLLRRGIQIECIHFAAPPYTQMAVIDKLVDLLTVLTRFQPVIRLHIIPFTELQVAIYEHATEGYPITVMRRMMYRIASRLASRRKIKAVATGESLSQVASQTLESLNVINNVTNIPIIRPLAVVDKLTIIKQAVAIGTYDISIRPYDDCCTIFKPVKPKTKPRLQEVEAIERKWDYQAQIDTIFENIETKIISK